jgi:hypothetical protein
MHILLNEQSISGRINMKSNIDLLLRLGIVYEEGIPFFCTSEFFHHKHLFILFYIKGYH